MMKERTLRDPNKIISKGNVAEVLLYNRECQEIARAIIDVEDVEKVKKHTWCWSQETVQTKIEGKTVKIQHVVLGVESNMAIHIDHKNRDTLNNRKFNLRLCTNAENLRNQGLRKNNTSGFKGVSWNKALKKWHSYIYKNGKRHYLGCFNDKVKAAMEYNKFALKYHGEFARLNNF